jgi:Ca2+-binding RTX toxin-like protein
MVKLVVLLVSLLVSGLWVASSLGPTAEAGHVTRCFGKRPDINRSHDPSGSFLVGTAGRDVIIASEAGDHIEGRGGRDFICALGDLDAGEDDEILGGTGSDKLSGGRGKDRIVAGEGDDLLTGGSNRDRGEGGSGGTEELIGGKGDDVLKGGRGRDRGRGGPGWDTCVDIEVRRSCEVVRYTQPLR